MQEELVTFKTAKLAKEKGFNIHCRWYFDDEDETLYENEDFPYNSWNGSLFAPTQALLQKWLREVHGIHIAILPKILPSNEIKYYCFKGKLKRDFKDLYNTYEEALEVGLQEALKLIKEN